MLTVKAETVLGKSLLVKRVFCEYRVQGKAQLRGGELTLDIHPHPLDWLHFENSFSFVIADYKSAFGKIAIDSLALLSDQNETTVTYESLLESHRHFSIGRQLYDDVSDIKEDFLNKQCNYAIYKLKQACEKNEINFEKLDEVYLEKYLYVLGVSDEILNDAVKHFENCKP